MIQFFLCLLTLGFASDVSHSCTGEDCTPDVQHQEFVQLRRGVRIEQTASQIPSQVCVERLVGDEVGSHREEGEMNVTATLFTVNNEMIPGRRKYMPGSIFQPSALNPDDNAASIPAGQSGALPEARNVSVMVLRKPRTNPPLSDTLTVLTMTFGQFIDHDIALVEEPEAFEEGTPHVVVSLCDREENLGGLPGIPPPQGCDSGCSLERLPAVCTDTNGNLQSLAKINTIAGFLEGHNVYGTRDFRMKALRSWSDGKLISQMLKDGGNHFELPPFVRDVADDDSSTDDGAGAAPNCGANRLVSQNPFLCGDVRCSENTALLAMHTLWLREHNRLAKMLKMDKKKKLPRGKIVRDQFLYTHARAKVVARIQKVLLYEFLPAVLGQERFDATVGAYNGYNSDLNPSISDAFGAAFYRFGHTLIPEQFNYNKNGMAQSLGLRDSQFNSGIAEAEPGIIDEILRGETRQQAEDVDVFMADGVRDELFNERRDLAALNIGRARDHNVAQYNIMRASLGLGEIDSFTNAIFSEAPEGTVDALTSLYGTPDRCDVFVCMLAENKVAGSQVGELLGTALANEFKRMRDGDQLWFENTDVWNADFIQDTRETTMMSVLRNNLVRGAESFPGDGNAFLQSSFPA